MKSFCAHGPDRPGRSSVGSTRPASHPRRRSGRERTPIIPGAHIATLVADSPMPEIIIQRFNFPNHRVTPQIHTYIYRDRHRYFGIWRGRKVRPSKGVILEAGSGFALKSGQQYLFGRRAKRRRPTGPPIFTNSGPLTSKKYDSQPELDALAIWRKQ